MNKLILITGPTGCGKSKMAVEIAKRINAEIISCDSMQIYKGLNIGTAKITKEEMQGIPHHMIDIIEPGISYSVTDFVRDAKASLESIFAKGKNAVMTGGTGLYADSFLKDIDFGSGSGANEEIRKELSLFAEKNGAEALHALLEEIDPESAEKISANNIKRVIRAIEYYRLTGEKISDHDKRTREKPSPYDYVYIVLTRDREELYERIDKRVDEMVKGGLLEEAKAFYDKNFSKDLTSYQAIGYKELFSYFDGECSLQDAIDLVKLSSRRYAKRQLTWFKRNKDSVFVNLSDFETDGKATEKIMEILREKGVVS